MNNTIKIVTLIVQISQAISGLSVPAVAFYVAYAVKKKTNEFNEFKQHDTQTQWVERLIKVSNTPDKDMGQEHFLIVQSTLRPFSKNIAEEYNTISMLSHEQLWNLFSYRSIIFVEDNIKYTNFRKRNSSKNSEAYNDLRMIANVLLKIHWENKEIERGSNKYEDILEKAILRLSSKKTKKD